MPKANTEKEWKFSMLPQANVFHPTLEEFSNPLKYISSIREVAKTTGKRCHIHLIINRDIHFTY